MLLLSYTCYSPEPMTQKDGQWPMDDQELSRQDDTVKHRLETLTQLGDTYERLGHIHYVAAAYIRMLAIYQQQADRAGEARVLVQLGSSYDELGDIDEAIESCEHSLAIAREIGEQQTEGRALIALGIAYGQLLVCVLEHQMGKVQP